MKPQAKQPPKQLRTGHYRERQTISKAKTELHANLTWMAKNHAILTRSEQ